jgi:hypothetical protein
VTIECLPYSDFIARRRCSISTRPIGAARTTTGSGIQGRFILSLNEVQGVRETFRRFRLTEVETTYTAAGGNKAKAAREVIIEGP